MVHIAKSSGYRVEPGDESLAETKQHIRIGDSDIPVLIKLGKTGGVRARL